MSGLSRDLLLELAARHGAKRRPVVNANRTVEQHIETGRAAHAKPILAACAFARHCGEEAERLSEPEWYGLAGVLGHCDDGREAFHRLSEPYPGYSPEETDRKLTQARNASKPRTCASIESDLGFSACNECPFKGAFASPIALGYADPTVAELASRFVYVVDLDSFLDLRDWGTLDRKRFDALHAHQLKHASQQLLSWRPFRKVRRVVYRPGEPRFLQDLNALNRWRDERPSSAPGPHEHIDLALEAALPNQRERDYLLDVAAYLLQNPGKKIVSTILLRGVPGTGKSTLALIFHLLVGASNFRQQSGYTLNNRFWDDLVNCILLFLDEVALSDRREVSNRVKQLQSEREIAVERKGLPFTLERTPDLIILASNNETPLVIEPGDRRFFVPEFQTETRDPAFWTNVHAHIEKEIPAFAASLLSRDVSAFNPFAAPPSTQAKSDLIDDSRPPLEQEIDRRVRERVGVFARDVVVPEAALGQLEGAGYRPNLNMLRRAFKGLGYVRVGQLAPGTRWGEARVWAVRDLPRWQAASRTELRNEVEPSGQSLSVVHRNDVA